MKAIDGLKLYPLLDYLRLFIFVMCVLCVCVDENMMADFQRAISYHSILTVNSINTRWDQKISDMPASP